MYHDLTMIAALMTSLALATLHTQESAPYRPLPMDGTHLDAGTSGTRV